MFLILILYFCLACGFAFGKAALTYMPPLLFVGIRMLIAGFVLVGYQFFVKKERLRIEPSDKALFAGMCLFHIYGAYVLEYWAMQYVSSFKASLLYNLSPFVTALLAYFLSKEIMTKRKWAGLLIGCIGMLPTFGESEQSVTTSGAMLNAWVWYAEFALIGSVLCAALGWILMKKLVQANSYSPVMVNGVSMVIGGGLALLTSAFFEQWPAVWQQTDQQLVFNPGFMTALWYMLMLIVLCNIISYNLYGVLLRSYSATFLSFAGFLTPLFTAGLSSFFFGQSPSIWFFVSVAIVGYGLYLFYGEELRLSEQGSI